MATPFFTPAEISVVIAPSEVILVTVKNVPLTSTVLALGPALLTVCAAPLASVPTIVNEYHHQVCKDQKDRFLHILYVELFQTDFHS